MLIVDWETRSRADLTKVGAANYARHRSTQAICCSFRRLYGDEAWTWRNPAIYGGRVHKLPQWVYEDLHDPAVMLLAHNAPFDRGIWDNVEHPFPPVPLEHWLCTSALARLNALPASLDDATRCLDAEHKKSHRGKQLIKLLSIPREDGTFNTDPDLLEEMAQYCEADVLATKDLVLACRMMTQGEHEDWVRCERINDRGICIDRELAAAAVGYAQEEVEAINALIFKLTNGQIEKCTQHQRVKDYVMAHMTDANLDLAPLERYKDGELKYSLDKNVRRELMDLNAEGLLPLPDHVMELIELTDDGNRSSVSKFSGMLARAGDDDRVRGAYVYAGAIQTQRFASRGLQVHNMRRDAYSQTDADALVDRMVAHEPLDDVMNTLSKLLRPALVPEREDHVFVVGDWSSIEAMALPWLADTPAADAKLQLFRDRVDVYQHTSDALGLDDRQTGKVVELSMGFGGAVGAFQAMARNFGVKLPDAKVVSIVKKWRATNSWAPDFWYATQKAAMSAVDNPGTVTQSGRIRYEFVEKLLGGTLLAYLPGDIVLQYPRARIEYNGRDYELTAIKANWKPKADAKHWPRVSLWHGLLVENGTQALCAGVLREAIAKYDVVNGNLVMHTHDELIEEVPEYAIEEAIAFMTQAMSQCSFTPGLPLHAEPFSCWRYGHKEMK